MTEEQISYPNTRHIQIVMSIGDKHYRIEHNGSYTADDVTAYELAEKISNTVKYHFSGVKEI